MTFRSMTTNRILTILENSWQYLTTLDNNWEVLTSLDKYWQLFRFLSILVHSCQFLSILVKTFLFLTILDDSCQFSLFSPTFYIWSKKKNDNNNNWLILKTTSYHDNRGQKEEITVFSDVSIQFQKVNKDGSTKLSVSLEIK